MRVLVIKTSSMGDIIHTLPALTDAARVHPDIIFDWVVEENFAEIPRWHSHVDRVIPVAIRRWRKNIFSRKTFAEVRNFFKTLRLQQYDLVIDAQGLMKSALLTRFSKGLRCGLDNKSAREPRASWFYQKQFFVDKNQHAITRVRQLFAKILQYPCPGQVPEYGIDKQKLMTANHERYLVFLHGTTWATKHWPEENWMALGKKINAAGFNIKLPWGNTEERQRAQRIAGQCKADVLPRLGLVEIAKVLAGAAAIVAVDTGLGHLAAAFNIPTISLYGPTNPVLTGALGESQIHLASDYHCAPCLKKECAIDKISVTPPCFNALGIGVVWEELNSLLERAQKNTCYTT